MMAYTNLTNSQLTNHGRVVLTFNEEERSKIIKLSEDLGLPSGQIVGTLVKKLLGFSVSKPLYESIMKYMKPRRK